jgi:hypothetical protein
VRRVLAAGLEPRARGRAERQDGQGGELRVERDEDALLDAALNGPHPQLADVGHHPGDLLPPRLGEAADALLADERRERVEQVLEDEVVGQAPHALGGIGGSGDDLLVPLQQPLELVAQDVEEDGFLVRIVVVQVGRDRSELGGQHLHARAGVPVLGEQPDGGEADAVTLRFGGVRRRLRALRRARNAASAGLGHDVLRRPSPRPTSLGE